MTKFTDKAHSAEHLMRTLFPATPLQRNDHLSELYGADIWLKREDLSPVRSYKIRGALNAMAKVLAKTPETNVFVCASAGNHAQGVAFVCRHFGVNGVIFMPVTTPQQKIDKTRIFGGDNVEIRLVGDYFDNTLAEAMRFCSDAGGHFLSPFDDLDVIEGQASVAAEIVEQLSSLPDLVLLPVGGGGLSAGVTQYLHDASPQTRIRYVEPAGAASLTAALQAGVPIKLDRVNNFVDGAAVAQIGRLTFDALKPTPTDHVLTVPEDRICSTILQMLNVEGVVLEPAGALSIDALKDLRDEVKGKTVVCVTSGGNFDFERLPEVKERSQRYAGLKKYFLLRLPQRPGALRDFLEALGPEDDIARFEYMKKSARNFGSVLIGIETRKPENFETLYAQLDAGGFVYSDITNDETIAEFVL
ncbi:threonine ammonia-lyase IlvA [Aliiroseovarius sp. F47248L]|uniref:threonine ammonia-lyase IlvA n=1 Tax=Aliiroseovarius sp. F47248L TaxID=2926420 RepID=UPI001FF6D257|nr:threonine ammonia-lyase IlvA [Aliiroseovarius sp. F47248L]MCK0140148.1 threonine ammonia-lyase IlvA [Aliiroseovarius sp. F47248L]